MSNDVAGTIVPGTAINEAEDEFMDVVEASEHDSLTLISALFGVVGFLAAWSFKWGADRAWRELAANPTLKRGFVDRFNLYRSSHRSRCLGCERCNFWENHPG